MAGPWLPAAITAAGMLFASWLQSRSVSGSEQSRLSSNAAAQASTEKIFRAEQAARDRRRRENREQTLAAMGTRYNTYRLPILNRHGTGWPTQEQYVNSLRGTLSSMAAPDVETGVKV